VNWFTPLIVL